MSITIEKIDADGNPIGEKKKKVKAKKAKTKTEVKPKTKKAKTKVKTGVSDEIAHVRELVDIIIETNIEIQKAKDPGKKQASAKKELLDIVEGEYAETEEIIVSGDKGRVKFGECSLTRKLIDVRKAHELLGDEVFYQLASISLSNIDDYLTPAQRAKILEEAYGSRRMSILPSED